MSRQVAVYHFRDSNDQQGSHDGEPAPFGVLSLHLDLVAIVDVDVTEVMFDDEVCARAWIATVGRQRQSLRIGRGASKVVLKKRIELAEIVARIQAAPSDMGGSGSVYTLTYSFGWGAARAESWLIDPSPSWARKAVPASSDERSPHLQTAPHGACPAVLRPLWEPQPN